MYFSNAQFDDDYKPDSSSHAESEEKAEAVVRHALESSVFQNAIRDKWTRIRSVTKKDEEFEETIIDVTQAFSHTPEEVRIILEVSGGRCEGDREIITGTLTIGSESRCSFGFGSLMNPHETIVVLDSPRFESWVNEVLSQIAESNGIWVPPEEDPNEAEEASPHEFDHIKNNLTDVAHLRKLPDEAKLQAVIELCCLTPQSSHFIGRYLSASRTTSSPQDRQTSESNSSDGANWPDCMGAPTELTVNATEDLLGTEDSLPLRSTDIEDVEFCICFAGSDGHKSNFSGSVSIKKEEIFTQSFLIEIEKGGLSVQLVGKTIAEPKISGRLNALLLFSGISSVHERLIHGKWWGGRTASGVLSERRDKGLESTAAFD